MNCWNILREITPDAYYGCSYELNNPDILKNCSFTSGSFAQSGFHEGLPCLQFNYEAAKPGTTTVKLKFYYRYDAPDESGYCDNRRCGAYVECPSNYNSYYDTVTFSVTVTGEEITIKYIDGAQKAEQKGNAGDSFTIKNALTSQTGKEFLGWSETANAESAEYEAGKRLSLTKIQHYMLYGQITFIQMGTEMASVIPTMHVCMKRMPMGTAQRIPVHIRIAAV